MHKEIDYCTYEMSKMLKDLGYKESSMWWYDTVIDYPEGGGEVKIQKLVKGIQWLDYDSWHNCPEDFIICPMLYDAHTFLCEQYEWVPQPITKIYYMGSKGSRYEFTFKGTTFSELTFKKAFKCQIETAVKYYLAKKFENK